MDRKSLKKLNTQLANSSRKSELLMPSTPIDQKVRDEAVATLQRLLITEAKWVADQPTAAEGTS